MADGSSMSDQPFYAPNRKVPPRQPRAGERLWTVEKNGRRLACELRDDGEAGVEVQMFRDGEFLFGRRCTTRGLALEKADEWKAQYLREGGVLSAGPVPQDQNYRPTRISAPAISARMAISGDGSPRETVPARPYSTSHIPSSSIPTLR
jgi:hypothetical protein